MAEENDAPVGVLGFQRFVRSPGEAPSLFVDVLFVPESERGRGIGAALVREGVERARRFAPDLYVSTSQRDWYEHDPLWVKDGNIYTSAGISAGIDLALAWVEEDCGAGLAHEAARELVLFLRRPGGQPQLSVSLASQASEMTSLRELQIWIAEHLRSRLSVEELADRMAMSVRNFERVFTREVGTTPSQYVLQVRVEAARAQLERTDRGLKEVAAAAGFGGVDGMRRAFVRLLGITPSRYREVSKEG